MSNQLVTRELIGQFSNRLADRNLRVLEMQTQDGRRGSVGKRLALMALMIPEQEDKERCYPGSTQGFLAKRGWRTGVIMRGAYDGLDRWQVLLMAQVGSPAPSPHSHTFRKALGKTPILEIIAKTDVFKCGNEPQLKPQKKHLLLLMCWN